MRAAIEGHLRARWPTYSATERRWTLGPVAELMPDLRILEMVPPRKDEPVVYASMGASEVTIGGNLGLEFFLYSMRANEQHVELLSLVAFMHRSPEHHLDVGHTMNIGRPWEKGSQCDRLLVSLPYVAGSDFEYLHVEPERHVRFLWLVPITASEEAYRHQVGLEGLEAKFEEKGIDVVDPKRPSVA